MSDKRTNVLRIDVPKARLFVCCRNGKLRIRCELPASLPCHENVHVVHSIHTFINFMISICYNKAAAFSWDNWMRSNTKTLCGIDLTIRLSWPVSHWRINLWFVNGFIELIDSISSLMWSIFECHWSVFRTIEFFENYLFL